MTYPSDLGCMSFSSPGQTPTHVLPCHHQNSIFSAQNMHISPGQRLCPLFSLCSLPLSQCVLSKYLLKKKQFNASGSTIHQICEFRHITQILFSPFRKEEETAPVSLGCPKNSKMYVKWIDKQHSVKASQYHYRYSCPPGTQSRLGSTSDIT